MKDFLHPAKFFVVAAVTLASPGCQEGSRPPATAQNPMVPAPPPATAPTAPMPPPPTTPPPSTSPMRHHPDMHPQAAWTERQVFRLDFAVAVRDSAPNPPTTTTTAFSVTLDDGDQGTFHTGKNIALQSLAPPAPGTGAPGTMRVDTGVRVTTRLHAKGDDVLLEVSFDITDEVKNPGGGPASLRKITSTGDVLTSSGKSAVVMTLDEDKKHYELTVTPTRLR